MNSEFAGADLTHLPGRRPRRWETAKLATAPILLTAGEEEDMETICSNSAPQQLDSGAQSVSIGIPQSPCQGYTESLLEKSLGDIMSLPHGACGTDQGETDTAATQAQTCPMDYNSLLSTFTKLLSKGLAQTAMQITSTIQADLHNLGSRIEITEKKLDQSIKRTIQNTDNIQGLMEQLDIANLKIDDLENRSRRYNFRIRGVPESIVNINAVVQEFIRAIIPDIPAHRLELDRAHRALQKPRADGLPRDIIVKPHFYGVKDQVMTVARDSEQLLIQGHPIQIFADISPTTIQRRRALKPLLNILNQKSIRYKWSFPFKLSFSLNGKQFGIYSLHEGEKLFLQLGLMLLEDPNASSSKPVTSGKRSSPRSPTTQSGQFQSTKRTKDKHPG